MKKTISQTVTDAMLLGCSDWAVLLLRLSAGGMMISHGIAKIANYSSISANFTDPIGLGAGFSFLLITLAESVGSLFVILGFLTRLAALSLVIGMTVAAFFTFPEFAFATSELALLYIAVFLSVLVHGGGRYSLDTLIWGRAAGNLM